MIADYFYGSTLCAIITPW